MSNKQACLNAECINELVEVKIQKGLLKEKLATAIEALTELRHTDTWKSVKQINDFMDKALREVE